MWGPHQESEPTELGEGELAEGDGVGGGVVGGRGVIAGAGHSIFRLVAQSGEVEPVLGRVPAAAAQLEEGESGGQGLRGRKVKGEGGGYRSSDGAYTLPCWKT